MTHTIIRPTQEHDPEGPVIFLAGPIQGADDWQQEAIDLLLASPDLDLCRITIANPRGKGCDFSFEEQVNWESRWLQNAAEYGVILFWLAPEAQHFCERAYAQTTRFELGEWIQKAPNHVVVGGRDSFPGLRYIKHRLGAKRVHATLPETVGVAAHLLWEMS